MVKTGQTAEAEAELVMQCQAGDRQAFNRLVMQYQHLVYTFLTRMAPRWDDRDDLAQEVFVKVYHSITALKDPLQFKGWLFRIATTVYLDEYRRWKKRQKRFISDETAMQNQMATHGHPGEHLDRQELRQQVESALAQLPEEFRMAILLREVQELSYEEIASALNVSLGTVRSRIFRGRKLLQGLLRHEMQMES